MTTRLARYALAIVLLLAPAAHAQGKTVRSELPVAARTSWDNARELFDAQNWAAAKAEYEHAYEISKNPRVLFNVGVCEKNLGHYIKASAAFRKELAEAAHKVPAREVQEIRAVLATLEPLISTLVVTSNEPGATLTIDKEQQPGATPFTQPLTIDVGVHTLHLTKPGFKDGVIENLSVVSGTPAQANFTIQPLERMGHARIDVSGPPRAALYVDGRDVGNSPFDGELHEGPHVVEARANDYVVSRQTIVVKYRENVALVINLAPKRHEGLLRVTAVPMGAIIEVDGARVGTSHWEGPLTSKAGHNVVVRKDGYYTYTQEVVLDDDQERSIPVTLNAEKTWIWWVLGTAAVIGAGVAATYFIAQMHNDPTPGTLAAGSGWGTTGFHFHF
jgi:hypothetical protein